MYDPTMHVKTLARHVRKADFKADPSLLKGANLSEVIERAVEIGHSGFGAVKLKASPLRGKMVYQLTDLAEDLVARHINSNIKRVTGVKQDNRQFIVTCIKKMLSEGTPFRVYKFDVASFYESVSSELVLQKLEADIGFSSQSVSALRSLWSELEKAGVQGLPRGLGLSATLAEYLMRGFDRTIANTSGVWFFARFVDDILVITKGDEDAKIFAAEAESRLPTGLRFNQKSRTLDFQRFQSSSTASEEGQFDFLGYRFFVSYAYRNNATPKKIVRDTWLDIAPSKVKKVKTRIALSLRDFAKNADFDLLLSRTQLLTSNFHFVEHSNGARRTSGIYYNYPLISSDRSLAIPSLDGFLVSVICSPHQYNKLRPNVTNQQRQKLLNLRFSDGFQKKRFFAFGPKQLKRMISCWAYA